MPELLDALAACALPADALPRSGKNEAGEEVAIEADAAGPLVAQVFKTRIDPFVHKLSFMRIFSGTMKKDDNVHVSGARKAVKLHQLLEVQGSETQPVELASAGDIVAVAKVEDLHTGTVTRRADAAADQVSHADGRAGRHAQEPRRRSASSRRAAQDRRGRSARSTCDRDAQTKELVMNGMSELHLQMIRERLKRRDKVEVDTKEPKIPYRETIQATAEGSYRHKKQTGGRGQFGEVHIRMFPLPHGHRSGRVLHQGALSHACASITTTSRTTSCGSIRSSAARFPTTSCRPSKRASRNGWSAA